MNIVNMWIYVMNMVGHTKKLIMNLKMEGIDKTFDVLRKSDVETVLQDMGWYDSVVSYEKFDLTVEKHHWNKDDFLKAIGLY